MARFSLFALALASVLPASAARAQLYAIEWDSGDLYQMSTANAALTLVGGTGISGSNNHLASLDFGPGGFLYSFTASPFAQDPTLYRIDPANASATALGGIGLGVFEGGLAIGADEAWGVNNNTTSDPQLMTVNLATGAGTVVASLYDAGSIGSDRFDINGLELRSDGQLVGLDRISNSLVLIDPSDGAVSLLASVTPDVGGIGGMALLGGTGYFVTGGLAAVPAGTNELYSFDVFTGAQTLIGEFNLPETSAGFSGLAIVPEPASLALLALGTVGALRRRR